MRRRGPGGPVRRPFRRGAPFRVPPELRHANELRETGSHDQAALAFEEIARRTAARNGVRAPIYFLRAGQAYALAGESLKGLALLKEGLGIIAKRRDWAALQRLGQRTVAELNEAGCYAEADEISVYLATILPANLATSPTESQPTLPAHCPGCGAPLRTDEVEWIDEQTAECLYCGSPVRGED